MTSIKTGFIFPTDIKCPSDSDFQNGLALFVPVMVGKKKLLLFGESLPSASPLLGGEIVEILNTEGQVNQMR